MSGKATLKAASERLATVRSEMKKAGVDGLLVQDKATLRYLFGFSGSTGIALVGKKNVSFITNDLYATQIQNELYDIKGLSSYINRDPWGEASKKGLLKGITTLGFVPSQVSVDFHKRWKAVTRGIKLVEVADIAAKSVLPKSKKEIASLAQAAHVASKAYEKMLGMVKPGMTEHEVATFLASTTRSMGSERDAFDIIVVAGKRSAMPHGRATHSKIKKGDVVTVDFGCCIDGLHSDMTRTFCVGTPTKKVVDVFAVLYEAHLAALDAVKANVKAADLDAAARNVIKNAGYGDYFRHSLGHGLGYEVHEMPAVSYANTSGIIPEDCVITIEPGIYLPGKFGMRIEDDVVVRSKGAEILTTAPRELVVV